MLYCPSFFTYFFVQHMQLFKIKNHKNESGLKYTKKYSKSNSAYNTIELMGR